MHGQERGQRGNTAPKVVVVPAQFSWGGLLWIQEKPAGNSTQVSSTKCSALRSMLEGNAQYSWPRLLPPAQHRDRDMPTKVHQVRVSMTHGSLLQQSTGGTVDLPWTCGLQTCLRSSTISM